MPAFAVLGACVLSIICACPRAPRTRTAAMACPKNFMDRGIMVNSPEAVAQHASAPMTLRRHCCAKKQFVRERMSETCEPPRANYPEINAVGGAAVHLHYSTLA